MVQNVMKKQLEKIPNKCVRPPDCYMETDQEKCDADYRCYWGFESGPGEPKKFSEDKAMCRTDPKLLEKDGNVFERTIKGSNIGNGGFYCTVREQEKISESKSGVRNGIDYNELYIDAKEKDTLKRAPNKFSLGYGRGDPYKLVNKGNCSSGISVRGLPFKGERILTKGLDTKEAEIQKTEAHGCARGFEWLMTDPESEFLRKKYNIKPKESELFEPQGTKQTFLGVLSTIFPFFKEGFQGNPNQQWGQQQFNQGETSQAKKIRMGGGNWENIKKSKCPGACYFYDNGGYFGTPNFWRSLALAPGGGMNQLRDADGKPKTLPNSEVSSNKRCIIRPDSVPHQDRERIRKKFNIDDEASAVTNQWGMYCSPLPKCNLN